MFSRLSSGRKDRDHLTQYFVKQILPILTPLAVEDLDPVPLLPGLQLQVAVLLEHTSEEANDTKRRNVAVVPVPTQLKRFIPLAGDGCLRFAAVGGRDCRECRIGLSRLPGRGRYVFSDYSRCRCRRSGR